MEAAPSSSSTSTSTSTSSGGSVTFYDFLDRMRNPASLDLVRSIKSFIVSFSFYTPNPDNDGKKVQDFYLSMEAAIREHPLWAAATFEELDSAMEGLEKYVMTKLFSRTFASVPEDAKIDREVSEKICLLQTFLKPEHLDIPAVLHNEASWLLAEKELQKINTFKAPREKLLCIMNCCRVINNLLLNASMSENHALAGLDDFLPVLIYVTIKANPPQLHSNLKFIQLYRRQAKLVSEAAYYFTNLVSAKTFIVDLNGKSLSMDEIKFEESMQAARLTQTNRATQIEASPTLQGQTDPTLTRMHDKEKDTSGGSSYPYMDAEAGELTVGDVERLLSLYKDVVTKYTSLYKVVRHLSMSKTEIPHSEGTSFLLTQPEGTNTKIDHQRGN
ncbi:vacuolar protein sorting-associated protein 9A-like isoform X1 [Quercus lobata]|uniref:vacuolar protein sorting-associated protein 9A-like isoform X1 n=1 Tax=Quercus lobata TaxID=97700 RepID=UPI001245F3CA|nr:vacuolar protein sorting-associated protein 9A-like isoform X1 [Quercus lobata]XP_030934278.1 vacuolar protein sorting-associated protein 9A-like isoform X1 [Quercus lobata]XP_030934279.1 vacuolar protein sorting-associated protein 9A-like isoform X1 [Quercus lobata]